MTHDTTRRRFHVDGLARVEGEGELYVEVRDGEVGEVALNIFEPPRFFEALLRGRRHSEAPEITSRICGICPVAYQMSACAAIEDACGVSVDPSIVALRRLLYCGEWIQSHALHVHLLHAPDFLGCEDAVELAALDRTPVERGLELKRIGNLLMATVGGRSVHPVNVRLGGFYRAPDRSAVLALAEPLRRARDAALATTEWVASFEFPDVENDYRFVALRGEHAYPIESGRVASSEGLDTDPAGLASLSVEEQVARSTALQAAPRGEVLLSHRTARSLRPQQRIPARDRPPGRRRSRSGTGVPQPLPQHRGALGRARLRLRRGAAARRVVRAAQATVGDGPPGCRCRHGCDRGAPRPAAPELRARRRGDHLLGAHHAANLAESAHDRGRSASRGAKLARDVRQAADTALQQTVRNHDPCISCAAHFLDVTVEHHR